MTNKLPKVPPKMAPRFDVVDSGLLGLLLLLS